MQVKNVLLFAVVLATGGCATSRGEMALSVAPSSAAATDGTPVYIDEIVDRRVFEDRPPQPSTPSLKGGLGSAADEAIRSKAVARKRNTYGKALGDILLEGDQTVQSVTGDLLRESFNGAGYYVVDDRSKLGANGIEVDVEIEKFWAWFTPGFWSVTMESQVETALAVTRGGKVRRVSVKAYGKNNGQSGREANWIEAYRRGFEDYKAKFATEFTAF